MVETSGRPLVDVRGPAVSRVAVCASLIGFSVTCSPNDPRRQVGTPPAPVLMRSLYTAGREVGPRSTPDPGPSARVQFATRRGPLGASTGRNSPPPSPRSTPHPRAAGPRPGGDEPTVPGVPSAARHERVASRRRGQVHRHGRRDVRGAGADRAAGSTGRRSGVDGMLGPGSGIHRATSPSSPGDPPCAGDRPGSARAAVLLGGTPPDASTRCPDRGRCSNRAEQPATAGDHMLATDHPSGGVCGRRPTQLRPVARGRLLHG